MDTIYSMRRNNAWAQPVLSPYQAGDNSPVFTYQQAPSAPTPPLPFNADATTNFANLTPAQAYGITQTPPTQPDTGTVDYSLNQDQGDVGPRFTPQMPQDVSQLPLQQATVADTSTTDDTTNGSTGGSSTDKSQVIPIVQNLGNQMNPTDSPAASSLHEDAMKKVMSILDSQDPHEKWKEEQDKPWWQRNDTYAGLIGVGLSLLSGASPMEAFQNAETMRMSQQTADTLDRNRPYLLERYTADSVSRAISQKDPSLLKEKQMSKKDQFLINESVNDLNQLRTQENAKYTNDLAAQREANKPVSVSAGTTLINPNTGKVIYQAAPKAAAGGVLPLGSETNRGIVGQLQPYQDTERGVWMIPSTYKGQQTGQYELAKSGDQKTLNAQPQAQAQAGNTLTQIDNLLGQLKNPDGSFQTDLVGPVDYTLAAQYRKTGTGPGQKQAAFQDQVDALNKSMLPTLKTNFGPQISDSDVRMMTNFYGLNSANSEEELFTRMSNMRRDIANGVPGGIPASHITKRPTQDSTSGQTYQGRQGNLYNNTQIPPGAINALKQNPSMAAQFDQKYGAGSSKRVLGG